MAVVNRSTLNTINTVYRREFSTALEGTVESPLVDRLAMRRNSTKQFENYAWIVQFAGVRRWTGEREILGSFVEEYLLRNDLYEGTIETKVIDIEDDNWVESSQAQLRRLARAYRRRVRQSFVDLLNDAFTDPTPANGLRTIDNVAFFSNSHPTWTMELVKDKGTETYKVDNTGTFDNRTDAVLSEESLWTAIENFMLMTNYYGDPVGAMPNVLVVGPALYRTAYSILRKSTRTEDLGGGTFGLVENELEGMFEIIVEPLLGTSTRWFLFDTTDPDDRPFIYQTRTEPQFQMVGSVSANAAEGTIDEYVFMHDAVLHGVRARYGTGYGLPYKAYGSTGDA